MAEVSKYLLPALVVFVATYLVLSRFLKSEQDKRNFEIRRANQKVSFPTRLRAYERLTLLVERITPENLIPRVLKSEMPLQKFQGMLIHSIREEYEHNLSQQIYVSDEAWNRIVTTKESLIKLINMAASAVPQGGGAIDMSKVIFEAYAKIESKPAEDTLNFLKKEVKAII